MIPRSALRFYQWLKRLSVNTEDSLMSIKKCESLDHETDLERTKKLIEPNQALTHTVKNRGGKANWPSILPAFSKFTEVAPASTSHA